MAPNEDGCRGLAVVERAVGEHDRRFDEVRSDLHDATEALWAAVNALRARSQVHPAVAAVLATLTCMVGVLATFAVRGG